MRVFGCILLSLLALCGHAPRANAREPCVVSLRVVNDELIAEFSFATPQRQFSFASRPADIRKQSWHLVTPGLLLESDRVLSASDASFDRFSLRIATDAAAADRIYPVLQKIGGRGLLLHTSHLVGDKAVYETPSIALTLPSGYVALADGRKESTSAVSMRSLPSDQYVFVGPSDYAKTTQRGTFVHAPDMPHWLVDATQESLDAALSVYEQQLQARLPKATLLIVGYSSDAPAATWRGDASSGYVLALQFSGAAWQQPSDEARASLHSFVFHEVFHFWNSELLRSNAMSSQPWLHEGSAEYASLLLEGSSPQPAAERRERIEKNLNDCKVALGPAALSDPVAASGRSPYACGATLFWIADTAAATRTQPTFLDLWRQWLARAKRDPQWTYGVADFMSVVKDETARDAIELILRHRGDERWHTLSKELRALGIGIVLDIRSDALRAQLVDHLLSINCPQSTRRGMWLRSDAVELDSEPSCRELPSGTRLVQIEGHALLPDAHDAFFAAASHCDRHEQITLQTPATTINVACDRPLATPAAEFQISTLPPPK